MHRQADDRRRRLDEDRNRCSCRQAAVQFTFPTYERSAGETFPPYRPGHDPPGEEPWRTLEQGEREAMKLVVAIIKPHQVEAVTERPRQHRGVGHDPHRGPGPRPPAGSLRGVPRAASTRSTSCPRSASRSSPPTARPSRWRTPSSTTPAPGRSVTASSGSSRSTWPCGSEPARSVTKRSDASSPAWRGLVADPTLGGLAFGGGGLGRGRRLARRPPRRRAGRRAARGRCATAAASCARRATSTSS